jgi:hypothetical protein
MLWHAWSAMHQLHRHSVPFGGRAGPAKAWQAGQAGRMSCFAVAGQLGVRPCSSLVALSYMGPFMHHGTMGMHHGTCTMAQCELCANCANFSAASVLPLFRQLSHAHLNPCFGGRSSASAPDHPLEAHYGSPLNILRCMCCLQERKDAGAGGVVELTHSSSRILKPFDFETRELS